MHGKEHLAREPFARILGAKVTAPRALDTDRFETFSGVTPRTLSPVAAARAKAQVGIQTMATPLALAPEGSFSSVFGFGVEQWELLLFLDVERGLELLETVITTSPLPTRRTVESVEEAADYVLAAGFPRQGVMIRACMHDGNLHHKNLDTFTALEAMVSKLLAGPDTVRDARTGFSRPHFPNSCDGDSLPPRQNGRTPRDQLPRLRHARIRADRRGTRTTVRRVPLSHHHDRHGCPRLRQLRRHASDAKVT